MTNAPDRRAAAAALAAVRTRPPAVLALLGVLALALAALAAPAAADAPYKEGEKVQLTGLVTDPAGAPVPGVRVVLEMSRRAMDWRQLRRTDHDLRRVSGQTNERGEYTIEWPWDSYFNHFEVAAGVVVRHGRKESLEVLERQDVSERVEDGSPVAVPLVLRQRAIVDHLRDFLASVRSEDERKTYEEMGVPDDVKRVDYAGSSQEIEVSWWYFDAGRVYRFHEGRLARVDRFDPVQHF
jgi:hypothetical protein